MASLYERLGGSKGIDGVVEAFYRRVLADPRIASFFSDVDMRLQSAKQKAFLTMVFGGPNRFTGKHLREGHRHLVARGMNDTHFDAVLEDLTIVLTKAGVGRADLDEVIRIAESTREDVLDRTSAPST